MNKDRVGAAHSAGALLGAGSALSYGVTIVLNRRVAREGLGVSTALGIRFGVAALLLLAVLKSRGGSMLPVPGERAATFLLGAVGYTVESTFFYMGLERGTAAAVALLFYSFPAMVNLLELGLGWARPEAVRLGALALSVAGTTLVVLGGSRGDVTITGSGVVLSLASAATFAVYLLVSSRTVRRTDSLTIGAWVATGAACSFLGHGLALGHLEDPGGSWPHVLGNGGATAAAFVLMFAALARLGPSPTSVVMTLEAFFGVLLAAAFLDESIGLLQLVGGVAVLAAAALTALRRPVSPALAPGPGPAPR